MACSFSPIMSKKTVRQIFSKHGASGWPPDKILTNKFSYLIISDTSVGYDGTMAAVANLNLQNLVVLDGGGSSQMSLNGQTIFESQDGRPVADFIVLR